MRRLLHLLTAVALTLAMLCSSVVALAESKYVSIKDIRATTPTHWTDELVSRKGDTVTIDTEIIIPEVTEAPVVRVAWGSYDLSHVQPETHVDTKYGLEIQSPYIEVTEARIKDAAGKEHIDYRSPIVDTSVGDIMREEVSDWLLSRVRTEIPELNELDLRCYSNLGYESPDHVQWAYNLYYYQHFHDIPYLIGQTYWREAAGESGVHGSVPSTYVYAFIQTEYTGELTYLFCLTPIEELSVEVADIPLLPFEQIQEIFKQRAADGFIYELSEIRFGYMCFIDPDKKGEEYLLVPVWAGRGITRSGLDVPFFPVSERVFRDEAGFNIMGSPVVINAQTGEVYNFNWDNVAPDRRYVPDIITWDEVK